jgi:hypothetical protein
VSIVPPDPDSKSDSPHEPDLAALAGLATDWYWSELTGMCGGCGSGDCHPDICLQNRNGYCTMCPTRRATGEVR